MGDETTVGPPGPAETSEPKQAYEVVPNAPMPVEAVDAAIAETNGKAPTIDFRGLELQLPLKLPGSLALQFTSDPEEMPAMVRGFLSSALGASQMSALGRKIDEEGISFEDIYDILNAEVLEPLFGAYNLEPGKSTASPES